MATMKEQLKDTYTGNGTAEQTAKQALVFYRTRVYQMQPQNGQNSSKSVATTVANLPKLEFRTPLKLDIYFRCVTETIVD